jgi:hypothetical protein
MKRLQLRESQIETLVKLPETGMGYQKVKLTFKNGEVLRDMTVLNSELLLVEDNQNINVQEIEKIELEKK